MGQVRKVTGQVRITLFADGVARLEGDLEGSPAPLTKRRFYQDMLRAGLECLREFERHYACKRLILPPVMRNGR